MLNTVLGTRNTLMKRPDVVPTLMELTLELRRETKLKVATLYQKKKKAAVGKCLEKYHTSVEPLSKEGFPG